MKHYIVELHYYSIQRKVELRNIVQIGSGGLGGESGERERRRRELETGAPRNHWYMLLLHVYISMHNNHIIIEIWYSMA